MDKLKILPPSYLNETEEPLFRDLAEEIYLSDGYSPEQKETLKAIGVKNISYHDLLGRVKADLESPSSILKNSQTSKGWHSRSAQLMLNAAKQPLHLKSLCAVEMLPLQDGSWTSIVAGEVYYPKVGGVDIPQDLGLRLLDPESSFNPTRRELFDKIGVKDCDPLEVKNLIIRKYNKWNNVNLESSVSHIRFLFCHCLEEEEMLNKKIVLFDTHEQPIYRVHVTFGREDMIVDDLYFDSAGTYDVKKLCAKQRDSDGRSTKRVVHILHPAYMNPDALKPLSHDLPWSSWLQKYAEILPSPRLVNKRDPLRPSKLFLWIVENRSHSILGILKTRWHAYQKLMSPEIVAFLQRVEIVCVNGKDVCLKDTFVPLPDAVALAKHLKLHNEMRFMTLPPEFESESVDNWRFLQILGAGVAVDLKFYLEALRALICSSLSSDNGYSRNEERTRSTALRVYAAIEERSQVGDYKDLR